jgi:hypothetical protein
MIQRKLSENPSFINHYHYTSSCTSQPLKYSDLTRTDVSRVELIVGKQAYGILLQWRYAHSFIIYS